VSAAGERDVEPAKVTGFEAVTGKGVIAKAGGKRVAFGNAALMADQGH
jgi:Cu+-exporting ATPase